MKNRIIVKVFASRRIFLATQMMNARILEVFIQDLCLLPAEITYANIAEELQLLRVSLLQKLISLNNHMLLSK